MEKYLKEGYMYKYDGGIYINISCENDPENDIDCFSSMNMEEQVEQYSLPLIVETWIAYNNENVIIETLMNSDVSKKRCCEIFNNIVNNGGYKELYILNDTKDAFIYDKIMYIESYTGDELKYNLINDSFTY